MRYDVVLWGATGFTGELVAGRLLARRGAEGWALAGRSRAKLEAVRERLQAVDPAAGALPILTAEAGDVSSLRGLAAAAKVVCTTVGPYAQHGLPLVEACVAEGAHCCDLTGEVTFMRRSIDAFHEAARAKGVRIVHACGFDSIPSDLGAFLAAAESVRRHGAEAARVRLYVRGSRGGASGGTIASMKGLLAEAAGDKAVRRLLADPWSLLPAGAPRGPWASDVVPASWDADEGSWVAPFVMASTNAPVVRRSHALRGSPLGPDLRYSEVSRMGGGPKGWARAQAMTAGLAGLVGLMSVAPGRWIADRVLPAPGEGPDAEARRRGYFHVDVVARGERGEVRVSVRGDQDPGYGSTSGMLAEAALCLAQDDLPDVAGVLTPSVAMGQRLVERLPRAGVTFEVR